MSDGQPIDSDPFIPTGVDATPDRVADMLVDETIPVETVALLPEKQRPDDDAIVSAAERSVEDTGVVLKRLEPLLVDKSLTPVEKVVEKERV